jgi:hypothetical protein
VVVNDPSGKVGAVHVAAAEQDDARIVAHMQQIRGDGREGTRPRDSPEYPAGRITAAQMAAAARSEDEREASDDPNERMDPEGPAVDTGIGRAGYSCIRPCTFRGTNARSRQSLCRMV